MINCVSIADVFTKGVARFDVAVKRLASTLKASIVPSATKLLQLIVLALRASFAIWTLKFPPVVVPNFVTPPEAPVRIVNTLEDSLITPSAPPSPDASSSWYILLVMIPV